MNNTETTEVNGERYSLGRAVRDSANAKVLFARAVELRKAGRYLEAKALMNVSRAVWQRSWKAFQGRTEDEPARSNVAIRLAEVLLETGRIEAAIGVVERAIDGCPPYENRLRLLDLRSEAIEARRRCVDAMLEVGLGHWHL